MLATPSQISAYKLVLSTRSKLPLALNCSRSHVSTECMGISRGRRRRLRRLRVINGEIESDKKYQQSEGPEAESRESRAKSQEPFLSKLIGPAAIHSHAFDAADTDQLHADIVAAVPLVRARHQFSCRRLQLNPMADDRGEFRAG